MLLFHQDVQQPNALFRYCTCDKFRCVLLASELDMFQQGNGHLQFILFHLCVQSLSAGIVAYLRLVSRHFLQCESRGIAIDPWTMCTDLDQLSVARVVALCFWPYPYPELQTVTHFSIGVIMLSKPYKYWDEAIRLQIIRCVLVSRNLDLERILIC